MKLKRTLSVLMLVIVLLTGLCGCDIDTEPTTNTTLPSTEESTGLPVPEPTKDSATETPTTEAPIVETTEPVTEPPIVETTEPATEPPTVETTEPPTEAPHTHTLSDATCTEAKQCQSCGETVGDPLGHQWRDATCTEAKTCTRCYISKGSAAGHSYEDGVCAYCGKDQPNYGNTRMVWIPTNGGKKYHTKASCSGMIDPEYVTITEAEELGFTPCKRCH